MTGWRIDAGDGVGDGGRIVRPHQPHDLAAVAQEDEGRPQLDAERAPERPAAAVFDADVAQRRAVGDCRGDQRPRGAAPAAPARAELEDGRAGERVDLGTRRAGVGIARTSRAKSW